MHPILIVCMVFVCIVFWSQPDMWHNILGIMCVGYAQDRERLHRRITASAEADDISEQLMKARFS